jgi:ribosomal protein L39E
MRSSEGTVSTFLTIRTELPEFIKKRANRGKGDSSWINIKTRRQCQYNLKMRRLCANNVAVLKQYLCIYPV